jgi:HEAT repeat protein
MKNSLLKFNWNSIESYSQEQITYFLYLEGKTVEVICKIRNLDKEIVKQHILNGKIKYGILAKSSNEKDLFKIMCKSGKQDKIDTLNKLDDVNKDNFIKFIKDNYTDMRTREKEVAVWIIGELKSLECKDILVKALVHNHVNVRRMAVSAMGKIQNNIFEIALIRALSDENSQVVYYAIKALIKIKSEKALDKIKNIYDKTEKSYLKKLCKSFIEDLENKGE